MHVFREDGPQVTRCQERYTGGRARAKVTMMSERTTASAKYGLCVLIPLCWSRVLTARAGITR